MRCWSPKDKQGAGAVAQPVSATAQNAKRTGKAGRMKAPCLGESNETIIRFDATNAKNRGDNKIVLGVWLPNGVT
jgi:hypothetical protein